MLKRSYFRGSPGKAAGRKRVKHRQTQNASPFGEAFCGYPAGSGEKCRTVFPFSRKNCLSLQSLNDPSLRSPERRSSSALVGFRNQNRPSTEDFGDSRKGSCGMKLHCSIRSFSAFDCAPGVSANAEKREHWSWKAYSPRTCSRARRRSRAWSRVAPV